MRQKKAKWIWYEGEYEIYHHEILSLRREEFGAQRSVFWEVARPYTVVRFRKEVDVKTDTVLRVTTRGKGYMSLKADGDYPFYPLNTDIPLSKGKYTLIIEVFNRETFPSIFIDSEYCETDESWTASIFERKSVPAACEPAMYSAKDDPAKFPFSYKKIVPVAIEKIGNGMLYDFGQETFGPITVGRIGKTERIKLIYGETRGEALDYQNAIIKETLTANDSRKRPARAFRYIYIENDNRNAPFVQAEYEYLPIKDRASFSCKDDRISKIWDACSYTFHLNSREFYLDGIKRDRWVWSGDAYQSFMINRYLYFDDAIIKRTIKALLGKPPYERHVNKINDYSLFLIIAVWEYYFTSGDLNFVKQVWEKVKALYSFISGRLDGRGYVVYRPYDWIFIDWGDVEKGDNEKGEATCAEQILLWKTYETMSKLAELVGQKGDYLIKAKRLKKQIYRDFYDEDRGCFIDCKDSGRKHISRQANVLAVLYGLAEGKKAVKIAENVLMKKEVPAITTPYFKFYELAVLSKLGYIEQMQQYLEEYWGGMIDLGATTIWEHFDPEEGEDTRYGMYDMPYGKSLCHAWGSGPIYLLGRYCCGVYPTDVGYKMFAVAPNFGKYEAVHAVVPIGEKTVKLDYQNGKLTVCAGADGGVLLWKGKRYVLSQGKKVTI